MTVAYMTLKRKTSIGLIILTSVMVCLDVGFTLWGQAEYYWRNYQLVNEGNPFAKYLLVRHPGYFLVACLIELLLVLALVAWLKRPWNLMISMTVILWHSWGASSWLKTILRKYIDLPFYSYASWYLKIIFYLVLGIVLGIILWREFKYRRDNS